MIKIISRIIVVMVGLSCYLFLPLQLIIGAAHEGGPGVQILQPQVNPGEILEVEGFNLGTDLVVTIVLERDGQRYHLGDVLCDGHGDFAAAFSVPADLDNGLYTLTVIDNSIEGKEVFMATSPVRVGAPNAPSTLMRLAANPFLYSVTGIIFLSVVTLGAFLLRKRTKKSDR